MVEKVDSLKVDLLQCKATKWPRFSIHLHLAVSNFKFHEFALIFFAYFLRLGTRRCVKIT